MRIKRKTNLIIHNLPETNAADDTAHLNTIITDKLGITNTINITNATRLGERKPNKDRVLRITLETLTGKRKLLSWATKLRDLGEDDVYAKVYIRPDLTPKQQAESKNLYARLLKIRDKNPTNSYKIRRGRIIQVE